MLTACCFFFCCTQALTTEELLSSLKKRTPVKQQTTGISNLYKLLSLQYPSYLLHFSKSTVKLNTVSQLPHQSIVYQWKKHKGKYTISCDDEVIVDDNSIKLPDGEIIPYQNISQYDMEQIAPNLIKLLYLHRSLGTSLFNYVVTKSPCEIYTLLHTPQKRYLDKSQDYAAVLATLNNHWAGKTVIFQIKQIQKLNERIEFIAEAQIFEASTKTESAIFRFHLNRNNRIDLAMVSLFYHTPTIPKESICWKESATPSN